MSHLGHGEAERKEFAAAGGPSGDPILAGGIGQRGRGVQHEGGFQERFAVRVDAAPEEERFGRGCGDGRVGNPSSLSRNRSALAK